MKSPDRDAADETHGAYVSTTSPELEALLQSADHNFDQLMRSWAAIDDTVRTQASELATLRRREQDKGEAIRRFLDMIEARPDVRALFGLAEGHVLDLAWQAISPARRNSEGEWTTSPLPPGRNEG